jgi:hypothetical protein
MSTNKPQRRLPLGWLAVSAVANLLIVGGLLGLVNPALVPAISAPKIAWTLLGVGIAIEVVAVIALVQALRGNGKH